MLDTRERVGLLGNASALLAQAGSAARTTSRFSAFADDADPEVVGNVIAGLKDSRDVLPKAATRRSPYVQAGRWRPRSRASAPRSETASRRG
jgi:hypothetical protein